MCCVTLQGEGGTGPGLDTPLRVRRRGSLRTLGRRLATLRPQSRRRRRGSAKNPSHDVALFPEKWRDIADGKKAGVASLATLTLVLFIASTLQKVSIAGVSLITVQAPGSCPPMVEITLPQLHTITTSSSTRDRNEGSRIFHAVNASCKCSTRTFSCLKFPTRVV